MKLSEKAISSSMASILSMRKQTDWARVNAMRDEDIDLSDIPEVTEEQRARAVLRVGGQPVPEGKVCVPVLLDEGVLEYFKTRADERGYERLIIEVLEAYIRKQESESGDS